MHTQDLLMTFETGNPEETFAVAARFASEIKPGGVILLQGGLGAGKTQFVRGICAGLGMPDLWEVDSPTYTIVNHYDAGPGVDHIDLYRLEDLSGLDEIGFEDLLRAPAIKLIEWPERLIGYPLTTVDFHVHIQIGNGDRRSIRIAAVRGEEPHECQKPHSLHREQPV